MKKLNILLSLILICSMSYGQAIIQRSGVGNTVQDARLSAQYNLFVPRYADTTAALAGNSEGIDSCGAIIFTYDQMALWFRSCSNGKRWVMLDPSGVPSSGNSWIIGGNLGLFTSPVSPQYIGTKTNQGTGILTNNIARLTITEAGAWGLGAGLDYGTSGYVLTSNGSGAAPTWQAGGGGGSGWSLTGNSGTTAGTNFIGTTDSVDFVLKTKNLERFRVNARGALGLGTGTDYGSAGYLMKSNGASSSPSWVDPTDYLKTIYNSDGSIAESRYVDATAGSDLYFGKLSEFGTMQWFVNRFELIGSGSVLIDGADSVSISANLIHLLDSSIANSSATNGYVWTLVDDTDGEGTWKPATGGGGSGTVNSGTQYRLGYYATTGTAISEAAAITANRALISDANGVPTHSATTATQLGYLSSATGTTGTTSTNLVFSTSPTLVTPVLGTPTSVTLTNGTGLPISTGVSGLGSNVATFLGTPSSANLASAVTDETGSGALVFATSPTLGNYTFSGAGTAGVATITNINYDLLIGNSLATAKFRFLPLNDDIYFDNTDGGDMFFRSGVSPTAVTYMTIKGSGVIQMQGYGAGTATFDASGNISSVSDERLKTKIKPYNSGIKELMQLRPIQYSWNDKSGMETKGTYAGFSAQNVKDAIPLGTGENPDGYLSLQERAIIATLVNVAQQQQKEIEKLKKEVKKLKKRQ